MCNILPARRRRRSLELLKGDAGHLDHHCRRFLADATLTWLRKQTSHVGPNTRMA